tara:strand:+ start:268 stop:663 length:396 start_codon:yes stop_codon:yes gene_type:complete
MNYTFSVGFEILSTSEYDSLSTSNRQVTRTDFLNLVQTVIDKMGVDNVSDPAVELDSRLTAASSSGQVWLRGSKTDRGRVYFINPNTGELECRAGFTLELNGLPYQALVTVAGVEMAGTYFVSYSANNGPY